MHSDLEIPEVRVWLSDGYGAAMRGNMWQVYTRYIYTTIKDKHKIRYRPMDSLPRIPRLVVRRIFKALRFGAGFAFAYSPAIYFNRTPGSPGTRAECADQISSLFHELGHILDQRELGSPLRWVARYYTDERFRAVQEINSHLVDALCNWYLLGHNYDARHWLELADHIKVAYRLKTDRTSLYGLILAKVDTKLMRPDPDKLGPIGSLVESILDKWRKK